MADDEAKPKKSPVWQLLSAVMLVCSIGFSGCRLANALNDNSGETAQVYELQAACANAGLSSDAEGNCYQRGVDPAQIAESDRAGAVVAAPPPGPTPIGGVSQTNGPDAPGSRVLAVPPAPAGSGSGQGVNTPEPDPTAGSGGDVPAGSPGEGNGFPDDGPGPAAEPDADGGFATPSAPVAPQPADGPAAPQAPSGPAQPGSDGEDSDDATDDGPAPVVVRETIRITQPFNIQPDPRPVGMSTIGGIVDVGGANVGCTGWAGSDPDIVLTYTDAAGSQAGSSGLPLRVLVESLEPGTDTSLIINDPYGRWYCNDSWAEGKIDPMLTFLDAGYGIYDIWVGATTRGTGPGATVYITERPLTPAN